MHAEALAHQIHVFLDRLLAEGHGFVILGVDETVAPADNRFVQAGTRTGSELLAECVGTPYTSYRPEEIDEILSLGWFAPDPDERIGNFTSYWEPPVAEEAAALMALTLLQVHDLRRPDDLRIRAGRFDGARG